MRTNRSDRPRGLCVTVFRQVIYGLTALGLEWRSVLSSCGVDPELIDDPEARIPPDVFADFWPRAAELTGDPCLGLHLAEGMRPLAVNINGYLLMSSETVREGLERVARYQRVVFDAEWISLSDGGTSTLIRCGPTENDPLQVAVHMEYTMALSLKFLDWVTEANFHAQEARFRHPPACQRSEYERILGCPVRFQCPNNELMVSKANLDQPSLYANLEIAELHEKHAEHHLAELEDHSVSRKVKMFLMSHIDGRRCDLTEVAKSLAMSPRTIQRRLAEEHHPYHEILDDLRRDLCLEHLELSDAPLAEIAYLAGFSDTSALSRAVRRWTRQTPLQYRRSHRDRAKVDPASGYPS